MAEGLLMLALAVIVAPVIAACGRGELPKGPSWFDIPHDTNRAARRGR
ncbi:MAG: hypothetical protein K0Q46_6473 [Rhodococcus erythropolis]|jgi:hypothetical protein|nr:hypothetical protein [Rhodococcus erythropolis]MDF2899687.1 hypothetical protein [Rhodococcus erythropolis]